MGFFLYHAAFLRGKKATLNGCNLHVCSHPLPLPLPNMPVNYSGLPNSQQGPCSMYVHKYIFTRTPQKVEKSNCFDCTAIIFAVNSSFTYRKIVTEDTQDL